MPSVRISSLPVGAADPAAMLIINNAAGTQTQRVTAGLIAALSGPVHTVAGRTGAVALTSADISNFNAAAASVALTASPVLTVAGRSGTVALTSADIGNFNTAAAAVAATAAPVITVAGRSGAVALTSSDITNFNSAVVTIAATASPVLSVNGVTGAVTLNSGSIGAATAGHAHNSTAVTDLATAVGIGERWTTVTINNSVITTVADVYRLTAATSSEVRGITNAVRDGSTRAVFINVGVNNVTFVHNHSTDSAAFLCPSGTNFALGENEWAFGRYDPTSQRWRVTPNCCGGT